MQSKGKSMEIILSIAPNVCFGRKVYIEKPPNFSKTALSY